MNTENGLQAFHHRLGQIIGADEPFAWAKRAGIPSATFDRIWNGKTIPKAEHLVRISEFSGVSLDWLLKGLHVETAPSTPMVDKTVPRTKEPQEIDRLYIAVTAAVLAWYDRSNLTAAPDNMAELISMAVRSMRAEQDTDSMSDADVKREVTRGLDMANKLARASGWRPKKG